MNEFDLIRHYFQTQFDNSLDITGGSDDCASLVLPSGQVQHLSIDTMVAGRHFFDDMAPFDIGYRVLATAASDLAAAGATPWWFSLALSLPTADESWLQGFSAGLKSLADTLNIQLIGGDTTRGPLTLSVQVAGLTPCGPLLARGHAKPGELLCVGGSLGDAAGGLKQWSQKAANSYLRERYCRPEPQIALGQALLGKASSCIDISDGLVADAGHIAEKSSVAIDINTQQLPLSEALLASFDPTTAMQMALNGGDDYRLLFTVNPQNIAELQSQWPSITVIGQVREGRGVSLLGDEHSYATKESGFTHF